MAKLQLVESSIAIVKLILLGGYSGASTMVSSAIRNYAGYKGYSNKKLTAGISVGQVIAGILINQNGLIGYLPIIASVGDTIVFATTESTQKIRQALVVKLYAIALRDYPSMATSIITSSSNIIALYKNGERN